MAKVLGNLEIDNGNLGVNTSNPLKSIQVGGGSTSEVVRVYYSDASYMDITGFGLQMARAASYIRANTDKNKSLYIGNDGATWDTISHNANVTSFSTDTTEHMRINSSGNVGIGTTSPTSRLHLSTTASVAARIIGANSSYTSMFIGNTATGAATLWLDGANGDLSGSDYAAIRQNNDLTLELYSAPLAGDLIMTLGGTERMRVKKDGNVGIGTTSPADILSVNSSSTDTILHLTNTSTGTAISDGLRMGLVGASAYFLLRENANMLFHTNNTERMRITNDGKVGIGTTSPAATLHVDGSVRFEDLTSGILQVDSNGDVSVNTSLTSYTAGGDYGLTLSGTEFRLEDDRRRNSTTTDIYTGNTHDYTFYDASIGIRWYTAGSEDMRLENDGDLHVDRDVIAYSTTISDERLKDDVQTIESACEKVSSLRGVEYTWNSGSRKGQREIGVIAQEVEKVIPEIVREKKLPLMDDEVYKTVDYEKLVAVLIEANKELQDRVSKLESKLDGITE